MGAEAQAQPHGPVEPLPAVVETVLPQGAAPPDVTAVPGAGVVNALETALLQGEASPSALARLWESTTGWVLLAFLRYYHGLSLAVVGRFFGVHKSTVLRWLVPLAEVNWQAVVQRGARAFSGTVAVDEKWLRIGGVWWHLFAAVDHGSGFPLQVALFPANTTAYCTLFLLQLKALGYTPTVIITDGWDAYVRAIATVFPQAEHLLCRFHALQAAFRRLRAAVYSWKDRQVWVARLSRLFRTASKRTVRRRLAKLQAAALGTPVAGVLARLTAKMPKLLPAIGSTFRPSTTNAAERFLGAFDRFYRCKRPFPDEASARKHLALFMLGYVFTTFSAEAKAAHQGKCPLQLAGYPVGTIPLFHLLNRPNLAVLRQRLVAQYAPAI